MRAMPRQRHTAAAPRRPGRWVVICAIVFGASLALAVTVWASGAPSAQQTSQSKHAQMQQMAAQATAAAKSWHAPKGSSSAASGPASCPRGQGQTGLFTGDTGGFHEQIVNGAHLAPNGGTPFEYVVYAGALRANPQQGVLIVVRLDQDPCAPSAPGTTVTYHPTPYQRGALTITAASGTAVAFRSATGSTGSFDVVTGQYS